MNNPIKNIMKSVLSEMITYVTKLVLWKNLLYTEIVDNLDLYNDIELNEIVNLVGFDIVSKYSAFAPQKLRFEAFYKLWQYI